MRAGIIGCGNISETYFNVKDEKDGKIHTFLYHDRMKA